MSVKNSPFDETEQNPLDELLIPPEDDTPRQASPHTHSASDTPLLLTDTDTLKPKRRWVFSCPQRFEDTFRRFDDVIIRIVQSPLGEPAISKCYENLALVLTTLTSIELGVNIPFLLYMLARDRVAERAAYLVLATSVLSQIPKRFLWRPRPWMSRRAVRARQDRTSSFPSRAVTCAVVYGYIIGEVIGLPDGWAVFIGVVFAIFSAISRITLGAHYPSDCASGLLLGLMICVCGVLLYDGTASECGRCIKSEGYRPNCYTFSGDDRKHGTAINLNVGIFFACLVTSTAIDVLSIVPPLFFWVKGHHVYGMLLPCISFHFLFLCPRWGNGSMGPPKAPNAGAYLIAIFGMLTSFVVAAKTRHAKGWKSLLVFLLLFLSVFVILAAWRMSHYSLEDAS